MGNSPRLRKKPRRAEDAFKWKKSQYVLKNTLCKGVMLYVHKDTRNEVVKKVINMSDDEDDPTPRELRIIKDLPKCNHIVSLLAYEMGQPEPKKVSMFFQWYPLGDVNAWRYATFENRNNKPVPEAFIWRFFIQMSQALAFIHTGYGTNAESWTPLIHRDIKPENIMVAMVGTYPSFKLNDFGVSKLMVPGSTLTSTAGTYVWQPPELPRINTTAADIWSLGAVVHHLALGRAPVDSIPRYQALYQANRKKYPESYDKTQDKSNYWRSHVPRKVTPINVSLEDQRKMKYGPFNDRQLNAVYSDDLNRWMMRALEKNVIRRVTTDQLLYKMVPQATALLRKMSGTAGLAELGLIVEKIEGENGDGEEQNRDVTMGGTTVRSKEEKKVRGKKHLRGKGIQIP